MRVVQESFFQSSVLKLHTFVNIINSNGAGNPHRRRPGTAKFWRSQVFFSSPLGFKNTIFRGSKGRFGERSRPEYSSGNQYWIRVVHESFFQSSILHAFVKITNSNRAGNPHRRRLGQPNFDKVKGVFHQPLGLKKYHIKRKQEGDPVKGWGQNILLVTDTGSGLCRQA